MSRRRRSREIVLKVLYAREFIDISAEKILSLIEENFQSEENDQEFTRNLLEGIEEHMPFMDKLIEKYSDNWRLSRMSIVDRNILRIGVYQLLFRNDIPPKVVLNEAVDMAKKYGDSESGSFVNGILDAIWEREIAKSNITA